MRVSQVQLVQPFLALLFAVPVLGERLEATTVMFSLAVIAIVFIGKPMPPPARRRRHRSSRQSARPREPTSKRHRR